MSRESLVNLVRWPSGSPRLVWQPQPDITAYELATALPVLITNQAELYDTLPAAVQRHFRFEEEAQ